MYRLLKITTQIIILLNFCLPLYTFAEGKTYKASLALLKVSAESNDKGILVDLVKYWGKSTGNTITISVHPFKRSLDNVISGQADFHLPFIKNPHKDEGDLPFDYSTSVIFDVNFVLYTNKNKPVDLSKLSTYTISTDNAHTVLFDFDIKRETSVESALKKLNIGRIDGFIFADVEVDPILKQLNLTQIKRELYKIYHVHAVLPKGQKGKETDLMITEGLKKSKESGVYQQLLSPLYKPYDDWQI